MNRSATLVRDSVARLGSAQSQQGARCSGLSVVVPVKDESENVEPLVREIAEALRHGPPFEILYVDDGSIDETAARLRQLKPRYPMLRVVRHATSCGQSRAVTTGVQASRYEWIATLDGDGQNDPSDIPKLLQRLEASEVWENVELVIGWRTLRRDSWVRKVSSRAANGVRSRLLGDATPDTGCGLKLFRRELFLSLPNFDHMHRFLPALVIRAGGVVVSVPVHHRPRRRGESKYGVRNRLGVGIVDLFGVAWLQRRGTRPILTPDSEI